MTSERVLDARTTGSLWNDPRALLLGAGSYGEVKQLKLRFPEHNYMLPYFRRALMEQALVSGSRPKTIILKRFSKPNAKRREEYTHAE
eukprot:2609083-Pleurochrysis_carterae.AAC.2